MKKGIQYIALLVAVVYLLWALYFAFFQSGWGPGVWRWLIFAAVTLIAAAISSKQSIVAGVIMVVMGIIPFFWFTPSPAWLNVVVIVAGVLVAIPLKSEPKAPSAPVPPAPTATPPSTQV